MRLKRGKPFVQDGTASKGASTGLSGPQALQSNRGQEKKVLPSSTRPQNLCTWAGLMEGGDILVGMREGSPPSASY